ncbi:hypothetical protein PCASD_16892 [Puccinia coronata f. sp. avenae]|uniref:Uncharacterized protein n=1 Tax=Puccinia coronata f. sp. avenae TaxID=200324 RepID=A0A2N5SV18_9BASI|nr:hypothetical protein PCASD_16892 [Puccinia coronata f. sp. avenae]
MSSSTPCREQPPATDLSVATLQQTVNIIHEEHTRDIRGVQQDIREIKAIIELKTSNTFTTQFNISSEHTPSIPLMMKTPSSRLRRRPPLIYTQSHYKQRRLVEKWGNIPLNHWMCDMLHLQKQSRLDDPTQYNIMLNVYNLRRSASGYIRNPTTNSEGSLKSGGTFS